MADNSDECEAMVSSLESPMEISGQNVTNGSQGKKLSNIEKSDSVSQHRTPSTLLSSVLRRRNSFTLSSKSSKARAKSKTMKKRVSMPVFDQTSGKASVVCELVDQKSPNYQRPLPPSPQHCPGWAYNSRGDGEIATLSPQMMQDSEPNKQNDIDLHGTENKPPLHDQRITGIKADRAELGGDFPSGTSDDDSIIQLRLALGNKLPLRIKFVEGYCSEESEHNLSANEVYDIHFLNKTRIVTLKDKDGFMHKIPLASAMTFGIVYNPLGDYDRALTGYTFETCVDILTAHPMPTVICSTSAVESQEEINSLAKNEILVVKGIQKSKLRGRRFLRVFSPCANIDKLLPEECHGNFATKPSLVRLNLPQIVDCISNHFPVQAVIYVGNNEPSLKMSFPISGVITLCDCKTEMSLVASPVADIFSDGNTEENHITLHLNEEMMRLDVEVIKKRVNSLEAGQQRFDDYDDVVVVPKKKKPLLITESMTMSFLSKWKYWMMKHMQQLIYAKVQHNVGR